MKARAGTPARRKTRDLRCEGLEAKNRELARTLQVIEEVRSKLADQYDFAPIGFVTLDARGCILECNLTTARMLNRERSQLLTMPFFPHVEKSHTATFFHHLRACKAQKDRVTCELALGRHRSPPLPVELRSVPVVDPHSSEIVYRTTITDITERRRASETLRESEERYRELVELAPDGIFITREGVVIFANEAAEQICGVQQSETLIGSEFVGWARPTFRPVLSAALHQASTMRGTAPVEVRFAQINGTMVDVEVIARPFRHADHPAVLVVARDISRRKAAERHVLQISERERSSFGRDLHDSLCQNLMGAGCMAEALRNDLRELSPAAERDANQITSIIRQCADEARNLARGLCPVAMEKSGLVAALHELAASVCSRTRVDCALQCDESLTINDAGTATHLYRIAQEAVANAITHGHAKSLLIELAADNGRMTLRVQDDGKGLPARPKQSGMGLHTMRYRASIIGGSLNVRRTRPRGTMVSCTFPSNAPPS